MDRIPFALRRPIIDDAMHPSRRRPKVLKPDDPEAKADERAFQCTTNMHRHMSTCRKGLPKSCKLACRFEYPRDLQYVTKVVRRKNRRGRRGLVVLPARNHQWVNPIVPFIARGARSNHDAQVIADAWGSVDYCCQVAAYSSKPTDRDTNAYTAAIRKAVNRLPHAHSMKHRLQSLTLSMMGVEEIGAQHAVRCILGHSFVERSRVRRFTAVYHLRFHPCKHCM